MILSRSGAIQDLKLQVNFPLVVNGQTITTYRADFVYQENGRQVVEDVKGFRTREYRIKAKLLHAIHHITIRET